MPVFTDYKTVGEVGPVRSGRDQFFRLILPWQALYIHEGQSVVMQQYAIDYDYGKLNNNDGANGYRDYGRVNWAGKSYNAGSLALEHTMYTNADNIANYINSQNVDMNRTYNSTFFNFVDYRLGTTRDLSNSLDSAYSDKYGPVVSDGQYVEIVHSQSYKTRFIYDESTNQYKMQQNYSDGQWRDTVDDTADNKVLTFPTSSSCTPTSTPTPATRKRTCSTLSTHGAASATTATAASARRSTGRRAPRWRPCACTT